MGVRERGFTLIEMVIAVALLTMLLAAGAWAFSMHPNALAAAADDVDSALAHARAIAASSGNGATLVFAPRTDPKGAAIPGFELRLYRGRPSATNAVTATDAMVLIADASVREATLGAPPFALFIDSAGDASGKSSYPSVDSSGNASFSVIAQEPSCPTGGFTLTLTNPQKTATMTRTLPCRISSSATPFPNPSPTPNVPLVTPTAIVFHWPADAEQQFVATEWGYTHWFASTSGFLCGNGEAEYPNVLPSPYTQAYSTAETALAPSPPSNTPYSYPNSNGGSMNDAPAAFPLQPQSAGLCDASVQDEFGQSAETAVAVMGWLTATYSSQSATHTSGSIAIPASALPTAGSRATITLAKTFDNDTLSPQVSFTGSSASACESDLTVTVSAGTTPTSASVTPATASITLTVTALPPSALSCTGIIYNHYSDPSAPTDSASESGEGIAFTASLAPPTGPLTTLGEIVFWLTSGNGGLCSYAQLYLEGGTLDANAPNSSDAFNHTDSNGCVTNNTVELWATEANYTGEFSAVLGSCLNALTISATSWMPSSDATLSSTSATGGCSFQVQSVDQTVSNGGAKTVSAVVNSCGATSMTVASETGCEFTMPVSYGSWSACVGDSGGGGTQIAVTVTESPDPMLGTLTLVSSNGSEGTYLWTRSADGTQTISYTAEEHTGCKTIIDTHGDFTFN